MLDRLVSTHSKHSSLFGHVVGDDEKSFIRFRPALPFLSTQVPLPGEGGITVLNATNITS